MILPIKRTFGVLAMGACFSISVQAKVSPECERLVAYRDGPLVADLDEATSKLTMASSALDLVKKTQRDVKAVQENASIVNAAFQITLALKTVSGAVGSILMLNPETGLIMAAGGRAEAWVARVLSTNQAVSVGTAALSGSLPSYVFWETVGGAGQIGAVLKGVNEFAETLNEHKEAYKNAIEMSDAAQEQLKTLASALSKADARVRDQVALVGALNAFKNEIDKSCK